MGAAPENERADRGRDAIFFSDDFRYYTPDGYRFQRCEPEDVLPIVRHGRTVRRFFFWRCFGYDP